MEGDANESNKRKDYGDKVKNSNRIRQPLIGEDVLIPR